MVSRNAHYISRVATGLCSSPAVVSLLLAEQHSGSMGTAMERLYTMIRSARSHSRDGQRVRGMSPGCEGPSRLALINRALLMPVRIRETRLARLVETSYVIVR